VSRLEVDHVDVTTRYEGQSILVFGAVPQGTDVVIKMVSPEQEVDLSHKVHLGPVWLEDGHLDVLGVPGLVHLLSTEPLERLLDGTDRAALGLTLDSTLESARIFGGQAGRHAALSDWPAVVLRLKRQHGSYLEDGQGVGLDEGRLFYAHLDLPPESPLGLYRVAVYLVRDGKVVRRQQQTLVVRKVRLQQWLSHVAHAYPWTFGSLLTLSLLLLGLALGMVLRPPD
jgi:uncharacterized protein (TIGR02186 family)